jgi:predicted cytidylate kinase
MNYSSKMIKQDFPKISLTGDLGSGKSAVSRLLEQQLGFRIVSTGSIQREIAAKYGMSTLELNEYTKTHPEIDDEIDGKVTELQESPEPLIFDSRLAWHFAPKSFKVYLLVDPHIAAQRIFNDKRASETYTNIEETRQKLLARRQSELERFRSYYGINYSELRNYDLVVETSDAAPSEIADIIMDSFHKRSGNQPFEPYYLSPYSLFPTCMVCCSKNLHEGKISVTGSERIFLIRIGHDLTCKAIADKKNFVPVHIDFNAGGIPGSLLKSAFLKQWEEFNGFKFREYPAIYK